MRCNYNGGVVVDFYNASLQRKIDVSLQKSQRCSQSIFDDFYG
jgi:hypothetical protein